VAYRRNSGSLSRGGQEMRDDDDPNLKDREGKRDVPGVSRRDFL
jgi:hypothetical protein